jgi:MinD-like ATPase involved in chromosome partitioning or flagellar assembly
VPELQIISIVSGKGGVGKTMLAVAIANELAQKSRTILFDLDFFNRGLSGLFASALGASPQKRIAPPAFLSPDRSEPGPEDDGAWSISEIAERLCVVGYGDLDKAQTDLLETMDVQVLAAGLLSYIRAIAAQADCDVVVLDCHGGPDNTSFAACIAANHTLMVSEPDRITLHGTLNFLRVLQRQSPDKPVDIRMIFNKVVADFTPTFLFRFYDQYLKAEFGGHDLLAIYPLELYLTKAFEKVPLLTSVFPYSQLAVKSGLVLYELYKDDPRLLPPAARSNRNVVNRWFRTYDMGRWPIVMNTDFSLRVIGVYFAVAAVLPIFIVTVFYKGKFQLEQLYNMAGIPFNYVQFLTAVLCIWFVLTMILNWTRDLDRFLIYSLRTRALVRATAGGLGLTLLWLAFALLVGVAFNSAFVQRTHDPNVDPMLVITCTVGVVAVTIVFLALYLRRGVRTILFNSRYLEGTFQVAFSLAIGGVFALFAVWGPALIK